MKAGSRGRVSDGCAGRSLVLAAKEEGHMRELTCVITRVSGSGNDRLSRWCYDAPLGWLRRGR